LRRPKNVRGKIIVRNREPLSCERVVALTIELIDRHGIEDVSLRSVARELGVQTPSLYHHFESKDALLAQAARALLTEAPMPVHKSEDWRESLLQLSIDVRRVILRHPRCAPLLLRYFPRETVLPGYDRTFGWITTPPDLRIVVAEAVEKFTFGSALFAAAAAASGRSDLPRFDPVQHPNIAAALEANTRDEEEIFIEALRRMLWSFPDADS